MIIPMKHTEMRNTSIPIPGMSRNRTSTSTDCHVTFKRVSEKLLHPRRPRLSGPLSFGMHLTTLQQFADPVRDSWARAE
jgi:hypothetical protein